MGIGCSIYTTIRNFRNSIELHMHTPLLLGSEMLPAGRSQETSIDLPSYPSLVRAHRTERE